MAIELAVTYPAFALRYADRVADVRFSHGQGVQLALSDINYAAVLGVHLVDEPKQLFAVLDLAEVRFERAETLIDHRADRVAVRKNKAIDRIADHKITMLDELMPWSCAQH